MVDVFGALAEGMSGATQASGAAAHETFFARLLQPGKDKLAGGKVVETLSSSRLQALPWRIPPTSESTNGFSRT
eukprot:6185239-Amphidinium_carterae.1